MEARPSHIQWPGYLEASRQQVRFDVISRFRLELVEEAGVRFAQRGRGSLVENVAAFLHRAIGRQPREVAGAVFLDDYERLTGYCITHMGARNRVFVAPADVFTVALLHQAHSLVLFHNHPSGEVRPSEADILFGRRMVQAGETLDIPVLDNLILGRPPRYAAIGDLLRSCDGRRVVRPKYYNRRTGQTWSGRGSLPRWLRRAILDGHEAEAFLIPGEKISSAHRRQIQAIRRNQQQHQ